MRGIGIQIDGPYILRAVVKRTRDQCAVVDCSTLSPEDLNTDNTQARQPVISGLHSNDLIIRSRSFAPARSKKLRQAFILQVEAQLYLKAEDLITVTVFESSEKRATTYSTTHAALHAHLQTLQHVQMNPERVSAIPSALKAFIKWKAPELSSYFLIHIGREIADCIWVEKDLIQKAHAISLGKARQKNDDLSSTQSFSLDEHGRFRRELLKIVHSFQCQRPLIFTGDVSSDTRDFLMETLCECVSDEKKINASDEEQHYAIPIGLAIEYVQNRKQPIQFRVGHFFSGQNWQKLGRRCACLIGASAMLAASIYGFGSWWMEKREKEIVHVLESWTAQKDPSLRLELFSAGTDTNTLVNQWIKLVEQNAKDYRFLMKAPKVSETLDWLTHHPLLNSFIEASDPISFEQIRYQLVSFPHLEALEDPYLAKVELEFTVNSPLHARKFHEMLLQESEKIDSSHEVSWEVLPGRYRTAFYLKNNR